MNDNSTSVFRWSAKANRRRSKHHIFAPLRLRVNKITRSRMRSQYEELVRAETRSRGEVFTMDEPGWLLFSLTAEGIGIASSLPKRNISPNAIPPRLRANKFFGCVGDWRRYVREEAQRLRIRVEVALMHRSARGSSGRLAVFAWGCRRTVPDSSEYIASFADQIGRCR